MKERETATIGCILALVSNTMREKQAREKEQGVNNNPWACTLTEVRLVETTVPLSLSHSFSHMHTHKNTKQKETPRGVK